MVEEAQMIIEKEIKNDLKDIKFYYENYEVFCNAADLVGANKVVKTAEKYNKAMTNAPPRLYKLYLYLYCRKGSFKYGFLMATLVIEKTTFFIFKYLRFFRLLGER